MNLLKADVLPYSLINFIHYLTAQSEASLSRLEGAQCYLIHSLTAFAYWLCEARRHWAGWNLKEPCAKTEINGKNMTTWGNTNNEIKAFLASMIELEACREICFIKIRHFGLVKTTYYSSQGNVLATFVFSSAKGRVAGRWKSGSGMYWKVSGKVKQCGTGHAVFEMKKTRESKRLLEN